MLWVGVCVLGYVLIRLILRVFFVGLGCRNAGVYGCLFFCVVLEIR